MEKSRKYHLACVYIHNSTLGIVDYNIIQEQYEPITQSVIENAIELIRKDKKLDKSVIISPLCWQRYEVDEPN